MEQIGTSHIATADLIIFGSPIFLIILIQWLPATSRLSIVIAVVCGCMVLGIMGLLLLNGPNLNSNAVYLLAFTALWMCYNLGEWNRRRKRLDPATSKPPIEISDSN